MYPFSPDELPVFEVFLLIGSNMGQREQNLHEATQQIESKIGQIRSKSAIYESAAWGKENQNTFLNQVLISESELGPWEIMDTILEIESDMGRIREEKWGSRLIDIDILYYGEAVINAFDLLIPHPEIQNRRFTLIPMVEIAREKIHPQLRLNQQQLLDSCKDELWVKEWTLKN